MTHAPWHPADLAISLDCLPAYGHPPGERATVPPLWLADAMTTNPNEPTPVSDDGP